MSPPSGSVRGGRRQVSLAEIVTLRRKSTHILESDCARISASPQKVMGLLCISNFSPGKWEKYHVLQRGVRRVSGNAREPLVPGLYSCKSSHYYYLYSELPAPTPGPGPAILLCKSLVLPPEPPRSPQAAPGCALTMEEKLKLPGAIPLRCQC